MGSKIISFFGWCGLLEGLSRRLSCQVSQCVLLKNNAALSACEAKPVSPFNRCNRKSCAGAHQECSSVKCWNCSGGIWEKTSLICKPDICAFKLLPARKYFIENLINQIFHDLIEQGSFRIC